MSTLPKIIVIVGPTASGKTALSLELANQFNGEIINADSRQVYRGMDIGTAKEISDGKQNGYVVRGIRHHLIDVVNPDEEFTLAHYKKMAFEAIDGILSRGKMPIVVGGTGLYVRTIVDNPDIPAVAPDSKLRAELEKKSISELAELLFKLDPKTAEKIDLKNPRRLIRAIEVAMSGESFLDLQNRFHPRYDALQIGLALPREELNRRINARVDQQIKDGLVEEVKNLAKKYSWELPAMSGIGYKQIGLFLRGEINLPEAIEMIKRDTRQYAKRQMTWFKRDDHINWINDATEAEELAKKFI
ncbi:MAG: tRNA (adenosine(37)-N6)-dimethylallyltransferase MiaA [Patescibacteria group bacterium]